MKIFMIIYNTALMAGCIYVGIRTSQGKKLVGWQKVLFFVALLISPIVFFFHIYR